MFARAPAEDVPTYTAYFQRCSYPIRSFKAYGLGPRIRTPGGQSKCPRPTGFGFKGSSRNILRSRYCNRTKILFHYRRPLKAYRYYLSQYAKNIQVTSFYIWYCGVQPLIISYWSPNLQLQLGSGFITRFNNSLIRKIRSGELRFG